MVVVLRVIDYQHVRSLRALAGGECSARAQDTSGIDVGDRHELHFMQTEAVYQPRVLQGSFTHCLQGEDFLSFSWSLDPRGTPGQVTDYGAASEKKTRRLRQRPMWARGIRGDNGAKGWNCRAKTFK